MHQTRGKDYLIKISIPTWWVLKRILGMNELFQRKKGGDGWGILHRRNGGREGSWRLGGIWHGRVTIPNKILCWRWETQTQKRLETVEQGQVSLERPTSIQAKGFDEWFLRGAWGRVLKWNYFRCKCDSVVRNYKPGTQSLGCYCIIVAQVWSKCLNESLT